MKVRQKNICFLGVESVEQSNRVMICIHLNMLSLGKFYAQRPTRLLGLKFFVETKTSPRSPGLQRSLRKSAFAQSPRGGGGGGADIIGFRQSAARNGPERPPSTGRPRTSPEHRAAPAACPAGNRGEAPGPARPVTGRSHKEEPSLALLSPGPIPGRAQPHLRQPQQDPGRLDELAAGDAQLGLGVGV